MEKKVDAAYCASNKKNVLHSWIHVPYVGMKFGNVDEAWRFWLEYGIHTGFEVRKRYTNLRKIDDKVTSCRFVCSKEGHRVSDKRDHLIKRPRPESRTDCEVRMSLKINLETGNYEVSDLVLEHNHTLLLSETLNPRSSKRKISEEDAFQIEVDDILLSETLNPRSSKRKISEEDAFQIEVDDNSGRSLNFGFSCCDHKNYLPGKRQREIPRGEAGSMLKYFQETIAENPSFQYALQMDSEEKLANIFWADPKMIIDYANFGDVVSFDTTFGTDQEYKPFSVFVGFNQFRETIIFGAALLYDKTFESFKWLFEAFLKTHNGKQPRTIFTDQDIGMGQAVAEVFSETWHALCTAQIMQNAKKHLPLQKNGNSNIISDFSSCMYEYKEESKFVEAFGTMRNKVQKQTWLDYIYELKGKWAECYMKNVITLGMRNMQLSENLRKNLKQHLKLDVDIIQFFKHFESLLQVKRKKELESEFDPRRKLPRIKMRTPMLLQASKQYTPIMFESFQAEYERSMAACAVLDGENEYRVSIGSLDDDTTFEDECKVIGNSSEQTALCSCEQFKTTGILCAHALKVLDLMNIKSLPSHYVLKRWTWEARNGAVQDIQGGKETESLGLDAMRRNKFLSRKFLNLAYRAANFPECSLLVDKVLDLLAKKVEDRIHGCQSTSGTPCKIQEDGQA